MMQNDGMYMNTATPVLIILLICFLGCMNQNNSRNHFKEKKLSEQLIELSIHSEMYFDSPIEFYDNTTATTINSITKTILSKNFKNDSSKLDFIVKTVFKDWGIVFIDDRSNIEYISPKNVLHNHKGSCLGISLVILLIGESLELPLYGVVVPGHFFVRYDNKSTYKNIETMKQGTAMPDNWYFEKFSGKTYRGLKCLQKSDVISLIHYNLGTVSLEKGNYYKAIKNFRLTLKNMPDFYEGRGNLAVGLERLGKIDDALKEMLVLKQAGMQHVDRNIAVLYLKKGDYLKAQLFFNQAIIESGNDPDLLYGLAVTEFNLGDLKTARSCFNVTFQLKPDYFDAFNLRKKLQIE
jgi:tetratricopeptide (TPR) repeat protein